MTVTLLRPRAATPLAEALPRLQTLVSPYTGIVRRLTEPLRAPTDPALIRVGAEVTDGEELLGASLGHLREGTGGSAPDRDAAVAAAIGEAAERYAAAYLPEERFVLATAHELGPAAAQPESFALFADWQYAQPRFPFRRFDADTVVRWAPALRLPDGGGAFLPVQLVYLGVPHPSEEETPIGYSTSNGMACAPTIEEAILGGLLELVERDAFMLTWYSGLSLPRLDWTRDAAMCAFERRYFSPSGAHYAVIDLSRFLDVPTALAVLREPPSAALAVGASSASTIAEAWRKALSEAFAVRNWARSLSLKDPARVFRVDFSDVRTFADHIHFYGDEERAEGARFLDASAETRDATSVPPLEGGNVLERIEAVASRLAARELGAYAIDITSPDVAAAGLRVAKAVAPGLCPLDVNHQGRYLGGERLVTAAWRLGLRTGPLLAHDVNPNPHPFP